MTIRNFYNKATEDINYGQASKVALKLLPQELHRKAQIKLARLGAASSIQDLRELRGNRLEALQGDRKGKYSIRINDQYRICFRWEQDQAFDVEIVDYHR
ncbi:MAG TPA: plasmid maintenance system killer protein [Cyanobacteria bacterium UBA11149]|nr:plasmid maintenance system killer protein [Cyanobacteria bacterium UBA11367]HBK63136.1 plasmid maintenance system killer protein [Cyanobacteria bacterium UBA11166]HBR72215.1 plasmid maintenance system killer protein [Cyanobacteria bacterium UBA11159]HBS68803.1 plasmid maintenance system killer protein [Cyanobacteria bacterium UBA11153]HBW91482.1 plasmid maintenance system killer protein [Cyanobacteria bacterium UBA11149]